MSAQMLMRFTIWFKGGQGVFGIAIGGVWREVEGTLVSFPSQSIDDLENNQRRFIKISNQK